MSIAGFRARNHPQQTRRRGANPLIDDRALDPAAFAELHRRFAFTIDAAATPANAQLPRFWTIADDALVLSWASERIWCNPPFSHIEPWVAKAHAELDAELIVMILPANRCELPWWQRWIEPHRDRGGRLHTEFLAGRSRFLAPGEIVDRRGNRPPFGCVLAVWT